MKFSAWITLPIDVDIGLKALTTNSMFYYFNNTFRIILL